MAIQIVLIQTDKTYSLPDKTYSQPDEYIFFFGENNNFGWLSNFFKLPFTVDGITFLTNEHFFMWSKCKKFEPNNKKLQQDILNTTHPKDAKQFGRKVKNFDEAIWDSVKFDIMKKGLTEKFSQLEYKAKLLDTNNKILVEASPYDKIWGIGYSEKDAWNLSKDAWNKVLQERNLLGKALMEVRTILKK